MATQNFFALLGDDENDDPSVLLARVGASAPSPAKELKKQPQSVALPIAKLPTKPTPPTQAVREAQADGRGRGGRRGGGRGSYGNRDRYTEGGYNRPPRDGAFQGNEQNDRSHNNSRVGYAGNNAFINGEAPGTGEESGRSNDGGGRGRGRGHGRGHGYGYMGDGEERPWQREYERRSGTGRGNEVKREGAGRGNWGVEIDQQGVLDNKAVGMEEEKRASSEVTGKKAEDVQPESENAEKKAEAEEDKEMTLQEYEKLLSEKRKHLETLKAKERKVAVDKEFESMQLVGRKNDEEVLLKVSAADKGKKKVVEEKDERSRKPVSINEFLKPVDGEEYYSPTGRRGRGGRGGGGDRGAVRGGYTTREVTAPSIEDPSHFPTLGGK